MPNSHEKESYTPAERLLRHLQSKYVVVGKTRVNTWHAWLLIGLAAGIATGIILVANNSGEFGKSRAAAFATNDRVTASQKINVQSKAGGGKTVGTVNAGDAGAITAGPTVVLKKNWWKVKWDKGIEGWQQEGYLKKIASQPSAPSAPANCANDSPTCTISFPNAGIFPVSVKVTDAQGRATVASALVTVGSGGGGGSHSECRNNACVSVPGAGNNTCSSNADCQPPPPPDGNWTYCANEGHRCNFTGTRRVLFIANQINRYTIREFTDGVDCNNSVFGDPAPGWSKSCAYETPPETRNWRWCARGAGEFCSFSGTRDVRYGGNNQYAIRSFTNGTQCSVEIFGDPVFGVEKHCDYDAPPEPPTRNWRWCAEGAGQFCSFSGTHDVRYGADTRYSIKTFTNGTQCNVEIFGDPAVGVTKHCDYDTNNPPQENLPKGSHDLSNSTASTGWACDSDDYNRPLTIHFYKDGPAGVGSFLGAATANLAREQGVADQCGGNPNHGFSFSTPDSLKDGNQHTVYAYALNIGPNANNPLLQGSPKTIPKICQQIPVSGNNLIPSVTFKTSNGQFVSADQGGCGPVLASGSAVGSWETFTLADLNGGTLNDGDTVNIISTLGRYFVSENDANGTIKANRTAAGGWESFTLVKLDGSSGNTIQAGDKIGLKTWKGLYVSAEGGGGGVLNGNRPAPGPWETFTITTPAVTGSPTVTCSAEPSTISSGGNTTWKATASGGSGAYSFSWADTTGHTTPNGNGSSNPNLWGPFSYTATANATVIVLDSNNKQATNSCSVTVTPPQTCQQIPVSGNNPVVGVTLRSSNGQYVVAEQGGCDGVFANRSAPGPWETFTLFDIDGGQLENDDAVHLVSTLGRYFVSENDANGTIKANRTAAGGWESFTLVKLDGSSGNTIQAGDKIGLKTWKGLYVSAEGGGGGVLNGNRPAPGPWETFTIDFKP